MTTTADRKQAIDAVTRVARQRYDAIGSSVHDATHIERVWRNSRRVAWAARRNEQWEINNEVLELAVFFHDLGRGECRENEHHAVASSRIAEQLMRDHGLEDLIWPVGQVILEHSHSYGREPSTAEGKVLRDADILDALGAVGIARCFAMGGELGTPRLYESSAPAGGGRQLDDGSFVLDHFGVKLLGLAEQTYTEWAREEARRRVRVMRAFRNALLQESGYRVPPATAPPAADDAG